MGNKKPVIISLEVTDSGAVRVLKKTADGLGDTEKKAVKAGSAFSRMGAKIVVANQAMQLFTRFGRPVVRQFNEMVKAGAVFEQRLANIATLLGDDATKATRDFSDAIREMTKVIPVDADALGAAAYQIVSAGITDTAVAIDVLRESARLGVAGLGTTADAANLMTSALNAFTEQGLTAEKAAATFFLTVKGGKTTISELAAQFGAVAPIAAELNVSFDQLQAATAALTTGGIATSEAQTNLRQAMVSLIKPTKEMSEVLGQFKNQGITTGRELLAQKGLVGAFRALKEATEGNEELLTRAIGRVQGLTAVLALSGPAGDRFADILASMADGANAFDAAFATAADTTANRMVLLSNASEELRLSIFNELQPAIDSALTDITAFVQSLAENVDGSASLIRTVLAPALIQVARSAADTTNSIILMTRLVNAALISLSAFGAFGLKDGFVDGLVKAKLAFKDFQVAADAAATVQEKANLALRNGVVASRLSVETNAAIAKSLTELATIGESSFDGMSIAGDATSEVLAGLDDQLSLAAENGILVSKSNIEMAQSLGVIGETSAQTTERIRQQAEAESKLREARDTAFANIDERIDPQIQTISAVIQLRRAELTVLKSQGASQDVLVAKAKQIQALSVKSLELKREASIERIDTISLTDKEIASGVKLSAVDQRLLNLLEAQRNTLEFQINNVDELAGRARALKEIFASISSEFKPEIETIDSVIGLRRDELTVLIAQGASQELIAAKTAEIATAGRNKLALSLQELTTQRDILLNTENRTASEDRTLTLLNAQAAALGFQIKNYADLNKAAGKLSGTTEKISLNIGESFRQGVAESLKAVVSGTRKISDVWDGVGDSILASFTDAFLKVLIPKKEMDDEFDRNTASISDLFENTATGIEDSFAGAFAAIGQLFNDLFGDANGGKDGKLSEININVNNDGGGAGQGGLGGLAQLGKFFGKGGGGSKEAAAGKAGEGASAGAGAAKGVGGAAGALGAIAGFVTAVISVFKSVKSAKTVGAKVAIGIGAAVGAYFGGSFGAVVGAKIGEFLGKIFFKVKARTKVEEAIQGFLNDLFKPLLPSDLKNRIKNVTDKDADRLKERVAKGVKTDDLTIALGLLTSSLLQSPFDRIKEFKLFDEVTGKIAASLENFPRLAGDFTDAILGQFDFNDAIDAVQGQAILIAEQVRGLTIEARPKAIVPPENVPGVFNGGKEPILSLETQQEALQRLIDLGLLIPLEDLVSSVAEAFSKDLPRTVRESIPTIVDRLFDEARTGTPKARARTKRGKVATISGEQLAQAIKVESEAFASVAKSITVAADKLNQGFNLDEAITEMGKVLRDSIQLRASEGITKAFFDSASFDNLLSPLFDSLDRGIQKITSAKNAKQARKRTEQLLDQLNSQFEFLQQNMENLAPVIEQMAELQDRIRLALTSFKQSADATRGVIEGIDNVIASFSGLGDQSSILQARINAGKAKQRAQAKLRDTLSKGAITDLADEDLKRLPDLLAKAANAIAANAQAELNMLEARLELTREWISLLPGARSALLEVRNFGKSQTTRNEVDFQVRRETLGDLIKQFRTGTTQEKISAAQQISQLAPQLLQSAEKFGLLAGSREFENIRSSLDSVLADIVSEGTIQKNSAEAIQARILTVQENAVAELLRLRQLAEEAQAELTKRSKAAVDTAENTGPRGPAGDSRDTNQKILARLNTGLNVYDLIAGKVASKGSPLASLSDGGLFTAKEGLALLHGPEVVIPLDKLPDFQATQNLPPLSTVRTQTSETSQPVTNIDVSASMTKVVNDDDTSLTADVRRFRLVLQEAFRDPSIQRSMREIARG